MQTARQRYPRGSSRLTRFLRLSSCIAVPDRCSFARSAHTGPIGSDRECRRTEMVIRSQPPDNISILRAARQIRRRRRRHDAAARCAPASARRRPKQLAMVSTPGTVGSPGMRRERAPHRPAPRQQSLVENRPPTRGARLAGSGQVEKRRLSAGGPSTRPRCAANIRSASPKNRTKDGRSAGHGDPGWVYARLSIRHTETPNRLTDRPGRQTPCGQKLSSARGGRRSLVRRIHLFGRRARLHRSPSAREIVSKEG